MTAFGAGVALIAVGSFTAGCALTWQCAKWRIEGAAFAERMRGYRYGNHDGLIQGRQEGRRDQALECARRNHPSHPPFAHRLEELPEHVTN